MIMPGDEDRLLIYFENEEHIIRRLGAAVVACWSELSPRVQEQIIERAERIVDEEEIGNFEDEMKRFILDNPHLEVMS